MASKQYSRGFQNLQYLSIAGGSLDFALLVSNVQHVKFIIDTGQENVPYFTFLITLLLVSIALQLLVVIFILLVNSTEMANRGSFRANNSGLWQKITLMIVMVISVLNVFIAVYGQRSNNTMMKRMRQIWSLHG
ncbi:hypothetical protein TYRP_014063 [Tyrophagus putrescentiae]|nr:hypothetical protein TYRP_014063 [Tyrophagus putrescentiae]